MDNKRFFSTNSRMFIDKICFIFRLKREVSNFKGFYPSLQRRSTRDRVKSLDEKFTDSLAVGRWCYFADAQNYDEESSSQFGLGQIMLDKNDWQRCMLEFNPNKCTPCAWFCQFVDAHLGVIDEVRSLDLAFDLHDVPTEAILFDAPTQSGMMTIGNLGPNPTRYLHPKTNDGRCKVYNKEKERAGKPDEDKYKGVTRVEFTFHNVGFLLRDEWARQDEDRIHDICRKMQQVKIPDVYHVSDATGLQRVHLYAIDNFMELGRVDLAIGYINQLSSNYRSRYRRYIQSRCFVPLVDDSLAVGYQIRKLIEQQIPCGISKFI